jgi:hypothetical protein
MSQQEFFPESQDPRQTGWSADNTRYQKQKGKRAQSGAEPKSEHPSAFEDSLPPHTYRAQDQPLFHETDQQQQQKTARSYPAPGSTVRNAPHSNYQRFSSPSPTHQGPGNQRPSQQQRQWQTPWWARPQQRYQRVIPTWLIILGVLFLLIPLLPLIFTMISILITGLVVIILIPFILIGLALLVALAWFILMLAGVVPRRRRNWWGRW